MFQSYRSLFYKGDDNDNNGGAPAATGRTPSAWLCPHSNRIALRVTSNQNNHIGADSTVSISAGSWNHIAFTFDNNTVNNEAFSATIFVNGVVDISVTFGEVDVVGNDGPLHFGRDLSNPGPRRVFKERTNDSRGTGGIFGPQDVLVDVATLNEELPDILAIPFICVLQRHSA